MGVAPVNSEMLRFTSDEVGPMAIIDAHWAPLRRKQAEIPWAQPGGSLEARGENASGPQKGVYHWNRGKKKLPSSRNPADLVPPAPIRQFQPFLLNFFLFFFFFFSFYLFYFNIILYFIFYND
jgi:hypothetical protein